jgi:hypothetical protein
LMAVMCCMMLVQQPSAAQVVIDGDLNEHLWQQVPVVKLVPSADGVPASIGGEIQAVTSGGYLYLSARLPEPSGRVVARSIGISPVWEGGGEAHRMTDARRVTYGAPEGEDYIRFVIRVYNENDWMLQVGPLGAYTIYWRWTAERDWFTSDPQKCDRFLVASRIRKQQWQTEVAIPLDQLGSPRPGYLRLAVERNRAERQGTTSERWHWPDQQPSAEVASLPATASMAHPVLKMAVLGDGESPLEVGRREPLPAMNSHWTDADWKDVPSWILQHNERWARVPRFPTEVKVIHNGRTLAVLARCIEPGELIARANERDGPVDMDDSFQVYLATSGSAYVQYAVNPLGYLLDAAGHQGSPRLSEPHLEWNSPVRAAAWREEGAWMARLDDPLMRSGRSSVGPLVLELSRSFCCDTGRDEMANRKRSACCR